MAPEDENRQILPGSHGAARERDQRKFKCYSALELHRVASSPCGSACARPDRAAICVQEMSCAWTSMEFVFDRNLIGADPAREALADSN
jgi:hypothetical protein